MALILDQRFPLGRFHATRWNQNPFEDPYGEWPPSPWRLLRALVARWNQYSRETGDSDPGPLRSILEALSSELPSFLLPAFAWRGLALRQYHPAAVEFTKKKSVPEFKRAVRSLALDTYQAVPPDQPIYWVWSSLQLLAPESRLLDELLRRMLYFGRAETYSILNSVPALPRGLSPNCILTSERHRGNPVLVPKPGEKLDIDILLAATDNKLISRRRIPSGAAWYYATLPPRPKARPKDLPTVQFSSEHRVIQFAVGGRVYPALERWIKVTERFRGRVILNRAKQLSGGAEG